MPEYSCASEPLFFDTLPCTSAADLFPDFLPATFGISPESTNMGTQDLVHQPSTLTAPTRKELGPLPEGVRRKLQYPIQLVKTVPRMMVEELQTPWCHPKLYEDEMPRAMQDAYSCCAMYLSKNRVNTPLILRNIDAKVNELLAQPDPSTPLVSLAHTQALLLYHIIRIFDGDISSRAEAERTQNALEDSALNLVAHVDHVDPLAGKETRLRLFPMAPTIALWKSWIFSESARRTLLFTMFLLQAYRILAGLPVAPCDGKLGLSHSFTLSAPLWHADSAVDFAKQWARTGHFVIRDGGIDVIVREAAAEDVDFFGRVILTSVLGVDEAEGWFASKGGDLWAGCPLGTTQNGRFF